MADGDFIEEGRCKRMAEERGIIKRIKRDPLRFDLVDLYDAVGRERKLNLNCAEDSSLFKNLINDSLDNSLTDTMIYAIGYLIFKGRLLDQVYGYVFDKDENIVIEGKHFGRTEKEARIKFAEQKAMREKKFGVDSF